MQIDKAERIEQLLARWQQGDQSAFEALLPLMYADLRRIASAQLRRADFHATLQTTALTHDMLVKLLERPCGTFESAAHLLNSAARIMRNLLVNRAQAAMTDKRGGGWVKDQLLDTLELPIPERTDLVELNLALAELERFDRRMASVVELRFFVGLEGAEIAATLGISERTVQRDWSCAMVWLKDRLNS